jgi:hypothetical protein
MQPIVGIEISLSTIGTTTLVALLILTPIVVGFSRRPVSCILSHVVQTVRRFKGQIAFRAENFEVQKLSCCIPVYNFNCADGSNAGGVSAARVFSIKKRRI